MAPLFLALAVATATPRTLLRPGALASITAASRLPAAPRGRRSNVPTMMPHPVKLPYSARDYLASTGSQTLADEWIASGLPRWVTLIDEGLFVVAAAIFVWGSFDFYPNRSYADYLEGCELFILGSLMQLGLALFATYEIVEDARRARRDPELSLLVEQSLYVAGSIFFTVGTILFTPPIGFLSSLGGIRTPDQPIATEAVERYMLTQEELGGAVSASVSARVAETADAMASVAGSVAEYLFDPDSATVLATDLAVGQVRHILAL